MHSPRYASNSVHTLLGKSHSPTRPTATVWVRDCYDPFIVSLRFPLPRDHSFVHDPLLLLLLLPLLLLLLLSLVRRLLSLPLSGQSKPTVRVVHLRTTNF